MSVLTIAAAKTYLNIPTGQHDAELQTFIDAAEAAVAQRCGPLASTATTARVRGGGYVLALPISPAVSLTSVTPVGGVALTLADLYLDPRSGLVTYNSGAGFSSSLYTVVYNAGRATCPDDLLMLVKEVMRELWKSQRGPTRRPGSDASEAPNTTPGVAYMLSPRASALMAPHVQISVGA